MTPTQQLLYDQRKARLARMGAADISKKKVAPTSIKKVAAPPPPPMAPPVAVLAALIPKLGTGPQETKIGTILRTVSWYYDIPVSALVGPRRIKQWAFARQVAMYLASTMTGRSTSHIARLIGDRDHTTVIHGIAKISRLARDDQKLRNDLGEIMEIVGAMG